MSTDQTTNLGLPFLMPAQAQKHVTVNESLTRLDALVQTAVESRSVSTQPGSPADGAVWIAPAGKTGPEWGGYADWALAYYRDGAWEQIAPREGWRVWVKDEDAFVHWTGSVWTEGAAATTIELGHASDTTISRAAAGVIAVEGGILAKEDRANVFTAAQQFATLEIGHASDATLSRAAAGVLAVEGGVLAKENRGNTFTQNQRIAKASPILELQVAADTEQCRVSFFDAAGNNDGIFAYDMAAQDFRWAVNGIMAVDMTLASDGGLVMAGATGGTKGTGTINAKAVYDDNVLLSCYVFDAALDGEVDLEKWDGKVPDRVTPELWDHVQTGVRMVEVDGKTVEEPVFERVKVAEARVETRTHDGARRFVERLGSGQDPLTLDGYAAHWKEKRHLPSLPDEATFDPEQGLPMGDWIQRLVETVEIQAVLIEALNVRCKALEARGEAG